MMAHALTGVAFVPESLERAFLPELHAAQRAFALVRDEGLSFREAYRRVAAGEAKDSGGIEEASC